MLCGLIEDCSPFSASKGTQTSSPKVSPLVEVVYDVFLFASSDLRHSAGFGSFSSRHVTMATRKSSCGPRQVGCGFERLRLSPGSSERDTRPSLSEELFEDKSNLE